MNADRLSSSAVDRSKQIKLNTLIDAPIERCFDLARSIDLHLRSAHQTQERAIAGISSGLISHEEEVEWQARHFGFTFTMRVRITEFKRPSFFRDQQIHGPFKSFVHDHAFSSEGKATLMSDRLEFESPMGFLGSILDMLVINRHLEKFLITRNAAIKAAAESDLWHQYLLSHNQ
jgi:ligand-binding SRPBCC domain-containing protein